ncbi:preprotein translocase subunit YajC [Microcella frigidaquae]|uniref:Preprotein translocase subunit YajC n=1 Tax=Microcella frigidaquae TaxID=424758 RepID=A0A840X2Q7_9MICO|nr:preprotein translocase subunit YajC [Microcella frigidaquae]MBB5616650.1 preprotein translocase subunit YajC [Microcella frigidaquae]NHN43908.1 preprotein translocase subunit YajC [Microcella frigidaquae]
MDPLTIVMLGILGLLVFFMFRNSRKRKQEMEELQLKMVPGAEVMTNFGLFGTLVDLDEENNVATIETSPGSTVRVHRQTLARVIEDEPVVDDAADTADAPVEEAPQLNTSSLDAPAEKPKRTKKSES